MIKNLIGKITGTAKAVQNRFDGATRGKRSGTMHNHVTDINDSLDCDLDTLKARSMGAYINSPMISSAVDQWVSDEIGSTAKITPTSSNDNANRVLSDLWDKHERFLSVGQNQPLLGVLGMTTRERRVNGEVFIKLVRRRVGVLPVPMQIHVISSNMVPVFNKTLANGNKIKQGIEFRGLHKVAVWFKKSYDSLELIRVPIKDVIHSYVQKFAGQVRGIPSPATALLKEADYNSYEENELNRKASQSGVVGMVTREGFDEDQQPGAVSEEADTDPLPIEPEYVQIGPNQILIGAEGEGLEMNNSPDVGQNYKDFTTNNQRLVSMGTGVPMQLVNHNYEGINDRTLRQINNAHRRKVKAERKLTTEFLITHKIWRWFVDACVLAGADLPNYWDNRDDYRKSRLTVEAFAYDHAVQDLQAASRSVKLNLHSERSLAEERGADYSQNLKERAEHIANTKKACEAAGITLDEFNGNSNV